MHPAYITRIRRSRIRSRSGSVNAFSTKTNTFTWKHLLFYQPFFQQPNRRNILSNEYFQKISIPNHYGQDGARGRSGKGQTESIPKSCQLCTVIVHLPTPRPHPQEGINSLHCTSRFEFGAVSKGKYQTAMLNK